MARSERLLTLLQVLRRHRYPVSGAALARETGVSLRTLYRDIATLQAQGADIEGEAGVGYLLRPGYMLPPLMFSREEIEALVLGSRWVSSRADSDLHDAASNALAKIEAVLPSDLKSDLRHSGLLIVGRERGSNGVADAALVRRVIREERKVEMAYANGEGRASERTIWPIALGYLDMQRIIVGWCELRNDFRHFRTDRVLRFNPLPDRYPKRRLQLLKDWREQLGISPPPF